MNEIEIIGAPQSPFVWSTRIACMEKGVPYRLTPAMPHTPPIDAIHPFGKMPVMRHGPVSLCESRAICLYVDRAFRGPPLVPTDLPGAAYTEQWLSLIYTHADAALIDRYLVGYFFPSTPDGSPDRALIDGTLASMRTIFAAFDRAVADTGYVSGESFTLANMRLLPVLFYMQQLPESGAMLADSQHLREYFERHSTRSSFRETVPPPLPNGRGAPQAAQPADVA